MKSKAKKSKREKMAKSQDFVKEYSKIINSSKTSVIVEFEWRKEGDYFRRLTIYDDDYTPIPTLGETTLINTP